MRTVEVATPANPAAVRSDANVFLHDRCWIPFQAAREPAAKATPSLVSMVTYLFSPLNLCGGHGDPVRGFRLRCGLRRAQFPSPAEPTGLAGQVLLQHEARFPSSAKTWIGLATSMLVTTGSLRHPRAHDAVRSSVSAERLDGVRPACIGGRVDLEVRLAGSSGAPRLTGGHHAGTPLGELKPRQPQA
jgi:hypothetical protein